MISRALTFTLIVCLPFAAWGDEGKRSSSTIFRLKSGDACEGRVVKEDRDVAVIETAFGRREVPVSTVVAREDAEAADTEFKNRANRIDKDDREGLLVLARWCKSRGLTSALSTTLDRVLRLDPADKEALGIVHGLSSQYRPGKKNSMPTDKPRWARRETDLLYEAAAKADLAQAALIRMRLSLLPDDVLMNENIDFAERGSEAQRWVAAYLLGRSKEVRRVKPLYRRVLGDPSPVVRQEALDSLKAHEDGTTYRPLLRALERGRFDATRVYAAAALGRLGDERAAPALLSALRGATGNGPVRNHVVFTRQQAYIKDYDVEIAQAAVIADPIVDIVTEGVVLDVGVVSINSQRRVFRQALASLTGLDHGYDVDAWETALAAR